MSPTGVRRLEGVGVPMVVVLQDGVPRRVRRDLGEGMTGSTTSRDGGASLEESGSVAAAKEQAGHRRDAGRCGAHHGTDSTTGLRDAVQAVGPALGALSLEHS